MGKRSHGKVGVHHVIPTSRRGGRVPDNELHINSNIHNAWHVLFGNLIVDEIVAMIKHCWQDHQGRIQEKYLIGELKEVKRRRKTFVVDKRLIAWQIIFGDTRSADEAIKIIKEKFTNPAPFGRSPKSAG